MLPDESVLSVVVCRTTENVSKDSVVAAREEGWGYWRSVSSSAVNPAFSVSVFVGLELAVEDLACFSRFNWELRFHRN